MWRTVCATASAAPQAARRPRARCIARILSGRGSGLGRGTMRYARRSAAADRAIRGLDRHRELHAGDVPREATARRDRARRNSCRTWCSLRPTGRRSERPDARQPPPRVRGPEILRDGARGPGPLWSISNGKGRGRAEMRARADLGRAQAIERTRGLGMGTAPGSDAIRCYPLGESSRYGSRARARADNVSERVGVLRQVQGGAAVSLAGVWLKRAPASRRWISPRTCSNKRNARYPSRMCASSSAICTSRCRSAMGRSTRFDSMYQVPKSSTVPLRGRRVFSSLR